MERIFGEVIIKSGKERVRGRWITHLMTKFCSILFSSIKFIHATTKRPLHHFFYLCNINRENNFYRIFLLFYVREEPEGIQERIKEKERK